MEWHTNFEHAVQCAHGTFQHDLLTGRQTMGGTSLRGKPESYRMNYALSAARLMLRLDAAGVRYHIDLDVDRGYWSAKLIIDV